MAQILITEQENLFFFFERINTTKPKSVLDIGMVLKRLAAVSRQAMSNEIPKELLLCGIDLFPEYRMKIYNSIYDSVIDKNNFVSNITAIPEFESAFYLGIGELLEASEENRIWDDYLLKKTKNIFCDEEVADRQWQRGVIKDYKMIKIRDKNFAWIERG